MPTLSARLSSWQSFDDALDLARCDALTDIVSPLGVVCSITTVDYSEAHRVPLIVGYIISVAIMCVTTNSEHQRVRIIVRRIITFGIMCVTANIPPDWM